MHPKEKKSASEANDCCYMPEVNLTRIRTRFQVVYTSSVSCVNALFPFAATVHQWKSTRARIRKFSWWLHDVREVGTTNKTETEVTFETRS